MRVYETANGLKFVVSTHAEARMSQRNIQLDDVEYILDNYNTYYSDRLGNRCYQGFLPDGRSIKLVLSNADLPTLITCIPLR